MDEEPHPAIDQLYFSNVSEDVWPFISEMAPAAKAAEIAENAQLSDRDLLAFAGADNTALVLPEAVNPDFLKYYLELFGNKNFHVLVPAHHTGSISHDVLRDKALVSRLLQMVNKHEVRVLSYAASNQFLQLTAFLKEQNHAITTPETPALPDLWTVNFFGSKSGIRQLVQQQQTLLKTQMVPGFITLGIVEAAKLAATVYHKTGGVVVKTNKGHSGAGVHIFRTGDLPSSYEAVEAELLRFFAQERYWSLFPIIIEELVQVNKTVGGGSPSVEFRIDPTGKVEFLYYCGMRVSAEGVFKGVEIHKSIFSSKQAADMMYMGQAIGEQYAKQGYRGYYDVDFVVSNDGTLYVTESNVRRTGGTHVYLTARHFFGPQCMDKAYILSNNLYQLPNQSITTFAHLYERLQPLLFTSEKSEGIIIAAANLLIQQRFAYIIFGKTKERAVQIEADMEAQLAKI